jgi:hexosaminidase
MKRIRSLLVLGLLSACGGGGGSGTEVPVDYSKVGSAVTQQDLDQLARKLQVKVTVVQNPNPASACPASAPWGLCVDAEIALTNAGPAFPAKVGWTLYLSAIRKVLTVGNPQFSFAHVNGDLTKLEPTAAFLGFGAGETKVIPVQMEYWIIGMTDVMPRWFLAAPELKPAIIANTDTEDLFRYVSPLVTPLQQLRTSGDATVIATAATRYAVNSPVADPGAAKVAAEIVPRPLSVVPGSGTLDLSRGVALQAKGLSDASLEAVAERLALLGVRVTSKGVPVTVKVDSADAAFAGKATAEAYRLAVKGAGVEIVGGDAAGAFYGLQSLMGLLPGAGAALVPQLEVPYDAPRYGYRGAQVDVARNFHGLPALLRVVDQLAAYKLNALHVHLGDDEGWRLEIPGLPELTDVGSRRCFDPTEQTCILPQLGSGPFADTSGTGHLTRDDFVTLLQAATARHVKVIPEFDMPGHARAAVRSMDARAAHGDSTYRLSDPDDTSVYLSTQYYTDNAMNACQESTYAFVGKVMDEVLKMYTAAGAPIDTWHIGADEVAAGAWSGSPKCTALIAGGTVASLADVHPYFVRRVNALAQERGLGIRGWSDGLRKTGGFQDPATDLGGNVVGANWWSTLFWYDDALPDLTALGYQVVLTNPDFLYLDHPQEADPVERGYYWATRYTSLRKLFGYISGNLAANAQLTKDRQGQDYTGAFATARPIAHPENIIGLEGAEWSETVRTDAELEYMMFPRVLALAERAWHRAAWEPADGMDAAAAIDLPGLEDDWARFAAVVGYRELAKLDRAGVQFRVDVPGAVIQDGKLLARAAVPGLAIQYKRGGAWKTYDAAHPPALSSTDVRAVSPAGRAGRAVPVSATP